MKVIVNRRIKFPIWQFSGLLGALYCDLSWSRDNRVKGYQFPKECYYVCPNYIKTVPQSNSIPSVSRNPISPLLRKEGTEYYSIHPENRCPKRTKLLSRQSISGVTSYDSLVWQISYPMAASLTSQFIHCLQLRFESTKLIPLHGHQSEPVNRKFYHHWSIQYSTGLSLTSSKLYKTCLG